MPYKYNPITGFFDYYATGGSGVTSFNTRTGAVTSTSGDYSDVLTEIGVPSHLFTHLWVKNGVSGALPFWNDGRGIVIESVHNAVLQFLTDITSVSGGHQYIQFIGSTGSDSGHIVYKPKLVSNSIIYYDFLEGVAGGQGVFAFGPNFTQFTKNLGVALNVSDVYASPPTAKLHLGAGTAAANTQPLKLNTGTAAAVVEPGAFEFFSSGALLTFTTSDGTRHPLTSRAAKGANSDITSLSGLTTPLTVAQGGIGIGTLTGIAKGNGTGAFTVAAAGTDYLTPSGSGAALTDITWAQINKATSDIADITTRSHASLTSIGTNTHAQIDTHIGLTSNPHSTSDVNLNTTDITTNDVSITKHGFAPKAPNNTTQYLRADATWATPSGGGGGLTLTTVEVDLGTTKRSGKFNVAGTGLTVGKPVLIVQANGAYTGKGTLSDEAEMDALTVSGKVTSATNIECFWKSFTSVKGNFKFDYAVSG